MVKWSSSIILFLSAAGYIQVGPLIGMLYDLVFVCVGGGGSGWCLWGSLFKFKVRIPFCS